MKAAIARVIRELFFMVFLGLLSAICFGNSAWARTASFTPTDQNTVPQSVDRINSVDVEPAAAGSIPSKTDQGPTSAQALVSPGTELGKHSRASLLSSYWFGSNRRSSHCLLPL